MGAHPYWYYVDYQDDIGRALQELREREYLAGRYNPIVTFPEFPIPADSAATINGHSSIEEAVSAAGHEGTRSILDLTHISETPDLQAAAPLDPEVVADIFGSSRPTRAEVEQGLSELLEDVGRGEGLYVIIYDAGAPSEILFAGYSFD